MIYFTILEFYNTNKPKLESTTYFKSIDMLYEAFRALLLP